jgi:hypothetical protein
MQARTLAPSGGLRIELAGGLTEDSGRSIADAATRMARTDHASPAALHLPDGGQALLKVYKLRRVLPLVHRLRPSRAVREARGLAEAIRRGLPCVQPLCWGERRVLGLVDFGFIATRRVEAPACHRAFRETGDQRILEAVLDELAAMHRAGLVHGDAAVRNWLWTPPRPLVFDLPSWGRFAWAGQQVDLVRLLGSVHWLTGGAAVPERLLARYVDSGLPDLGDRRTLLDAAARRAAATRRG